MDDEESECSMVDHLLQMCRDGLMTSLVVMGPVLLICLVVGLVVGALQTVTQIQDQTLSLVPRIVAILVTVFLCLPWVMQRMVEFSATMFSTVPTALGR